MKREIRHKNIRFFIVMVLFCIVLALRDYDGVMESYNTTLLAFTYKYGFISRGLLGSIYHLLNRLVPVDMMTYESARRFGILITGFFILFLLYFLKKCLDNVEATNQAGIQYLAVFFCIVTIPTFCSARNLARVDVCMIVVSLIGVLLLLKKEHEWMLVLLSAVGVMFHQGYVFMYFNIILVILICRILDTNGKNRIRYGLIFGMCFCVASALFLWFEIFSRFNGGDYVQEIISNATNLSKDGIYHPTLIDHEILGIDLADSEWDWHIRNFVELIIFSLLFLPVILFFVRFFIRVIHKASTLEQKWKYFLVAVGSATMIPDFLLKVDYGRWIMAVLVYYCVMLIALSAMGDRIISEQLTYQIGQLEEHPCYALLLPYLILFVPFWDVTINEVIGYFSTHLSLYFLHWW